MNERSGRCPWSHWTPLQVSGGASQEKLQKFGGQTPLGRPGQPVELASIYVQLAANDASYATGQVYGSAGVGATITGYLRPDCDRHWVCLGKWKKNRQKLTTQLVRYDS